MFNTELKSAVDEDICILIKPENHSYNYICDCGEAKALTVKDCQDTQAIFISHTHIDHFVNFDTILRHQIGIGKTVVICGPEGITNQVQNRIKSYCWNLIDKDAITYEVREIQENSIKTTQLKPPLWEQEPMETISSEIVFEEKDFQVEYVILNHKTHSIAYLFRGKDKINITLKEGFNGGKWIAELKELYQQNNGEALVTIDDNEYKAESLFEMISVTKGMTLGVILDHAATPENHQKIKDKFFDCDEVYIECFYKDEDQEFAVKNYHSYASMSGKIMKECKVKNAIPIHFSRKYNEKDIKALIHQFEIAKG